MTFLDTLNKLKNFFTKTKDKMAEARLKIEVFCEQHKETIKALMNVWQRIYANAKGSEKMEATVKAILSCLRLGALGSEYADDVTLYIEQKCQGIFDELVAEKGLEKAGT